MRAISKQSPDVKALRSANEGDAYAGRTRIQKRGQKTSPVRDPRRSFARAMTTSELRMRPNVLFGAG
jgi:hypothetical protein